SGAGPHPTVVLCHGLPGNEQNLDLAQAARRAGFVVLTLHYRGSWGSPGIFSFANASADGINAADWLIAPEQLARYQIDKNRLVLAGHSMGGFVALRVAAARPSAKGLLLLDAWNPGDGMLASLRAPGGKAQYVSRQGNSLNMLAATTAGLADEILDGGDAFDLRREAPALAARPVLVLAAEKANGLTNRRLAESFRASGNTQVGLVIMPTDHGFNDHRIALISASLDWLDQFKRKP
ncbi:alpha/beta fold hydrolase, partial [Sandarakinorhabdus sp.]|uniref:alpha/beta hydrolase family protein n=1 Tax=Sandarakinorhabdus sp. TaxID=1916663 RepID=UPI00286DF677